MKKLYFVLVFTLICGVVMAQTAIEGKIKEKKTGQPISYGTVALYKNGVLTTGVETDLDGNYFISDLSPGTYDVEVKFLGYTDMRTTGVIIRAGQNTKLNFEMEESSALLDEVVITEYRAPLVNVDNTTTGTIISGEKIQYLPVKGLNAIVATTAGVATRDGETPSIRGSRSNETMYMIDGIRTFGTVPQTEIDQLQIITGGIEAKYGDVTGGLISITTKGPSDKISGGFDIETSSLLTPYGYNLAMGYLTGPILKNKKGNSILGYRISGQYRSTKDGSPNANGYFRAPESVIDLIEQDPLYNLGTVALPSAEKLRTSDMDRLRATINENNKNLNLVGKIEAKFGSNMNLSLSGNYVNVVNRSSGGGEAWARLNWRNNPYSYSSRARANVSFKHKLGAQSSDLIDRSKKPSSFQNFSYTILGGFERGNGRSEDFRHKADLYKYGYFGSRAGSYNPIFGIAPDSSQTNIEFRHLGYLPQLENFVPGEFNPVLAKYNTDNGILDPDYNSVWNNLYTNVGQVFNSFSKSESDLVTLNISSGFDLLPGGSEKGRHNIQFGFIYEQQTSRSWGVAPRGLWRAADLLVNNHIKGIDPSIILRDSLIFNPLTQSTEKIPIFQTLIQVGNQDKFVKEIRKKLGLNINQYINLAGIDPSLLTLDLFSPQELTEQGLIGYSGYDYLGNKSTRAVTFEDFFREKDENGVRTFPVAPFSPIYMAGYVQDKFSYKDIIFRLGLRADYYDANTKVLKDPYALYDIETAKDFYARTGRSKPASVGDDYKVYVTGEESDEVIGYRVEDQWYNRAGTSVTNGNILFNGGIVYPSYVGRTSGTILDIQNENFDVNTSFEDYAPILNLMPRLAFSFPISEDAGFFAHYDVLYQRPASNVFMSPLDYYYFNNGGTVNNPALKPMRTIDYEVGFQQKISENNSIKLSGYTKEMKNLIQNRVYAYVPSPINTYNSYGNLDFGNVTGFTFQFDRRRVSNLELNATYTISFANGSGSDANSSSGLNSRGPIRNLIPLSFDERHRITGVIDYRYAGGKKYTGPMIGDYKIFENSGITITTAAVSGRPFTKALLPQQYGASGFLGEINGARLPWTLNVDLRADKRFTIRPTKEAKPLYANVYFRVQNLLDARNIRGVYRASGSPTDDGFLVSQLGQGRVADVIRTNRGIEEFQDAYSWALLTNGNYLLPRQMFIGLTFDF